MANQKTIIKWWTGYSPVKHDQMVKALTELDQDRASTASTNSGSLTSGLLYQERVARASADSANFIGATALSTNETLTSDAFTSQRVADYVSRTIAIDEIKGRPEPEDQFERYEDDDSFGMF